MSRHKKRVGKQTKAEAWRHIAHPRGNKYECPLTVNRSSKTDGSPKCTLSGKKVGEGGCGSMVQLVITFEKVAVSVIIRLSSAKRFRKLTYLYMS